MSQTSSPGRCCCPLSPIRCGGPSVTRTRTAAKRALSFPFVPVRGAPYGGGQHVFGRYRQNVRDVPLPGAAALGNRKDHPQVGGITLGVGTPPAQVSLRAVSSWRNGALIPYPA